MNPTRHERDEYPRGTLLRLKDACSIFCQLADGTELPTREYPAGTTGLYAGFGIIDRQVHYILLLPNGGLSPWWMMHGWEVVKEAENA